jgi:hypothetical protein
MAQSSTAAMYSVLVTSTQRDSELCYFPAALLLLRTVLLCVDGGVRAAQRCTCLVS